MKKFAAYVSSESSDDYLIFFEAKKEPKSDKEWIKALRSTNEFCDEELESNDGPGVGGSYLHVRICKEILFK